MGVFTRLAEFDGKSSVTVESIKRSTEVSPALLGELVEITGVDDTNMQIGATWLLRAYLEEGAQLDTEQVGRFGGLLIHLHDGFARLHVCQFTHLILIPTAQAEAFAEFFRACLRSKNTFLRAWAPSGFWRLAEQHPQYQTEARALIEEALGDPAPSVRARARKVLAAE